MAGSASTNTEITYTPIKKITFDWTSDDATGAVSSTSSQTYTGLVERAVFIPDAGGTQPTDLYDVVVNDSDGTDILHANGADLSNAATVLKSHVTDGLGAVVNSTLSLAVTNAGNSKGGKVIIYVR